MNAVWKFTVNPVASNTIEMPEGAKILTAMMQGSCACLWALVDPKAPKVKRYFHVTTTGEQFDTTGHIYIGSFQIDNFYMFHLFEWISTTGDK